MRKRKTAITIAPGLTAAAIAVVTWQTGALAATRTPAALDIATTPLFVTNNVKPNIVLAVDDSNSMDYELQFHSNDGAMWWDGNDKSFTDASGTLNFNQAGTAGARWKKYVYLFPDGTGPGNRLAGDAEGQFAVPPLAQFAYARSPAFNAAYFDPAVHYQPWIGYDDRKPFTAMQPTAAVSDPQRGGATFDLTQPVQRHAGDETFRLQPGMTLPKGTIMYRNGAWRPIAADQPISRATDAAIQYFPATFYLTGDQSEALGYTATPLTGKGPTGQRLYGYEIKPRNFGSAAAYRATIGNFANWYSYYRKRHLAVRGAIVRAFDRIGHARVGSCTINKRTRMDMRKLDTEPGRNAFYRAIYNAVGRGETPNRQTLAHLGDQLATNRSIIQHACQQNFAVLVTDGYADTWSGAGVGNADRSLGVPFADDKSNTMADIAAYFYKKLDTLGRAANFAKGKVPVAGGCNQAHPDARLDCNRNLHMVTFGVTLGQKGEIFGTGTLSADRPFAHPPDWDGLTLGAREPSQIDDLWHATLDSRGRLLNARRPADVAAQIDSALQTIAARPGSASAMAINTGTIDSDSRLYRASFTSGQWGGDLVSQPLADRSGNCGGEPVGDPCPALWDAAAQLDAQNWDTGREIVTRFNDRAIAFRYRALGHRIPGLTAPSLLNYLRGDRELEAANAPKNAEVSYRDRKTVLGDIVDSTPVYVGAPERIRYPLDWDDRLTPGNDNSIEDRVGLPYRAPAATTDFLRRYATRMPMVYVGANDGMLHGFQATAAGGGRERIAYIPQVLLPRLPALAQSDYVHRFYVDGRPVVGDAVIDTTPDAATPNNRWRTVLVAGLRGGGRAVFALDITDPGRFADAEAHPGKIALWEFTGDDHPDLGLTFGKPAVVRLHNGRWAAIFGNGYNNPGSASPVLYAVSLSDGHLLAKIDTHATPGNTNPDFINGLGSVFPVDMDGDFITDYVYAGDLYGNLWKFDLTAAAPNDWRVDYGSKAAPEPLFTARDASGRRQPITVAPQVGIHPPGLDHGAMVYFGTGKYLENSDGKAHSGAPQSFYGILDLDLPAVADRDNPKHAPAFVTGVTHGFGRDRLTRQTVLQDVTDADRTYRLVSGNTVQYQNAGDDDAATVNGANKRGWVLDLPADGEMVVTDATLRARVVAFSTLLPGAAACAVGGSGYLMVVDAATGGSGDFSALDRNGDRRFDAEDTVKDSGGKSVLPSGVEIAAGVPGRAGFVISRSGDSDIAEVPLSNTTVEAVAVNPGLLPQGRRSWRELRR